jgi:hypothetical protein
MLENLTPRTARQSKIDQIRDGLEPEDQKLFDQYLNDVSGWSPNQLALALSGHGIHVAGDTIRRYRLRHGLC